MRRSAGSLALILSFCCALSGAAEGPGSDIAAADKAQAAGATGDSLPPVHWQCDLSIAPLYRRAALTGVSMEWGERVVSALPGQVRARWAEGPTTRPAPPPTEKP